MADLKERVAYVHGLANGFDLGGDSKEGQVLVEVLDVLEAMAETISEVESAQRELEVYVESLDDDLAEMEEDFYGDDGDEAENDNGDWAERCPTCGTPFEVDLNAEDPNWQPGAELTCPGCGAIVEQNGRRRGDLSGKTQ